MKRQGQARGIQLLFRKHESFYKLRDKISYLIDKGDIDLSLRLIYDFVEHIITDPLCAAHVFGSKDLDELCQRIGHRNLATVKRKYSSNLVSRPKRPVFVYLVTKLQKSGGHTKIIQHLIKAQQKGIHIILSTELNGTSDFHSMGESSDVQNDIFLETASKANYQQRLTWLQKRLIELAPKKVYLFNHHQDSVATAAIQPSMNLNAYFYHHGDHHLCLGVYLSHLKHIDSHPMGYYNCRYELGIENIYVPLTIKDEGARAASWSLTSNHGLTTCTAARANKIEIPYFINYLDIVPQILKKTGGQHIHIGFLSPWARHKIHRGLKKNNIRLDRFIYVPWVPSVWNALHKYKVDLYISSFPYCGGLTLIEAMGAGVPVALHRHIFSRILSGIDLAYPGAFSWRYPKELLDFCENVTVDDLKKASNAGRRQYEKYHSEKLLGRFINTGDGIKPVPDIFPQHYPTDAVEWALWMNNLMIFRRLIYRFVYRIYRRIRKAA
jgi:hypothetical protein